jgi:hypothetical protein
VTTLAYFRRPLLLVQSRGSWERRSPLSSIRRWSAWMGAAIRRWRHRGGRRRRRDAARRKRGRGMRIYCLSHRLSFREARQPPSVRMSEAFARLGHEVVLFGFRARAGPRMCTPL